MTYINWEYYSSLYSEVPEEDFDRLCMKASAKLDIHTHGRAKKFEIFFDAETATDFQKEVHIQIKNTVCELMGALYVQETSGMGTGIASVSNDGYSESYKITTAAEKEAQVVALIREGLSGTGLASAL